MTNTPKTFGEMTPEEKGALLLAHHEGKTVEIYRSRHGWKAFWGPEKPMWVPAHAYRVKPEVKTVTARIAIAQDGFSFSMTPDANRGLMGLDTMCATLTFDAIDGKADWSTAKLEALE